MADSPAVRHRAQAEQMIADLTERLAHHPDATFVDALYRAALQGVVGDLGYALAGECPERPSRLLGSPLGQYHCPHCGCMVIAGMPGHPHDDGCWLGLDDEDDGPSPDEAPNQPSDWPPM